MQEENIQENCQIAFSTNENTKNDEPEDGELIFDLQNDKIDQQRHEEEFEFEDDYRYDESIINPNVVALNKSILNYGSDEIEEMLEKLYNDHNNEIESYKARILDLEQMIQKFKVYLKIYCGMKIILLFFRIRIIVINN